MAKAKLLKSNDPAYRNVDLRVIGISGEQLGIMSFAAACNAAREAGLDLVLTAEDQTPPVCRIQDYSKLVYEQGRRDKDQKKKAKAQAQKEKEMKLRLHIDDHDFEEVKMAQSRKFLKSGNKLKVTVTFKGREVAHPEMGTELMKKVIENLADCGTPVGEPSLSGKLLQLTFNPKSNH